jgi:hypothetical protein
MRHGVTNTVLMLRRFNRSTLSHPTSPYVQNKVLYCAFRGCKKERSEMYFGHLWLSSAHSLEDREQHRRHGQDASLNRIPIPRLRVHYADGAYDL